MTLWFEFNSTVDPQQLNCFRIFLRISKKNREKLSLKEIYIPSHHKKLLPGSFKISLIWALTGMPVVALGPRFGELFRCDCYQLIHTIFMVFRARFTIIWLKICYVALWIGMVFVVCMSQNSSIKALLLYHLAATQCRTFVLILSVWTFFHINKTVWKKWCLSCCANARGHQSWMMCCAV